MSVTDEKTFFNSNAGCKIDNIKRTLRSRGALGTLWTFGTPKKVQDSELPTVL